MAAENIPVEIRRFIAENIPSVETLEILLLLHSEPEKCWAPAEVSRRLYTSAESAASRLRELKRKDLLSSAGETNPLYQFPPQNGALRSRMDELEKIYKERRVSVISLIYSKPSDPIRDFSDAFRLRKDEDHG